MRGSRFNYEATRTCAKCDTARLESLFPGGGDTCELCMTPDQGEQLKLNLLIPVVVVESAPVISDTPPVPTDSDYRYRIRCEVCTRWVNSRTEPYAAGRCYKCWWPGSEMALYKQWRQFR